MVERDNVNIDEVLQFLSEPRLRFEITQKFKLSNVESYHLMSWLEKGKFVDTFYAKIEGRVGNKGKFYKAKNINTCT